MSDTIGRGNIHQRGSKPNVRITNWNEFPGVRSEQLISTNRVPLASKGIVNTYRTNVVANSGTISEAHLRALSTSLELLIRTSAWPKIKELWVPLGDNLAAALVKIKYPSTLTAVLTQDNVVEGDYVPVVGITGGTNRRIKSDFNPSVELTTASAGIGVFTLRESWTTNAVLCGSTSGTSYYLHFAPGTSKLGSYTTPTSADHRRGRAFQWGQFRSGNAEFGSGRRITFSAPATASAMSGAFSVFSTNNTFFSDATVGGYALFDAMTPDELGSVDLFFKQVNAAVGRDSFAPSVNFIGDSITTGIGASGESTRWATIFAARYGFTRNNQGQSGATLKAPPFPTFAVYPLTANLYNKPSALYVLALGTNDARNFAAPSTHLEDFDAAYRVMLDTLAADGVSLKDQVILMGPIWVTDTGLEGLTRSRYLDYVAAVAQIADDYGLAYVDAYAVILAAGGASALADNVHPNDTGHAALAAAVQQAFESLMVRQTLTSPL